MKKIVLSTTVLIALGFAAVSCSKKKDSDPTPSKSPKELLTTGSWQLSKTTTTFEGKTETAAPEACEADDSYTFKTNNTLVTDEGATKCDAEDPQTDTDPYTLSEDGKTITMASGSITLPATIVELTDSKMILKINFIAEITMEYKKK